MKRKEHEELERSTKRAHFEAYAHAIQTACTSKETHREGTPIINYRYWEYNAAQRESWLSTRGIVNVEDILLEADSQLFSVDTPIKYMSITTDQDAKIKAYVLENMDVVLQSIPTVLSDEFTLIPAQVLAIYHATALYPFDRVYEATFRTGEMQDDIRAYQSTNTHGTYRRMYAPRESYTESVCIPANEFQRLQILCYGTGTGKTVMTIVSSMLLLCDAQKWTAIQRSAKGILAEYRRESESSIVRGLIEPVVARLVICFVPKGVLSQWEKTAQNVKGAVQRHFNMTTPVRIWIGNRKNQGIQECINFGNEPTLWFLSLESKSLDVLFQTPHVSFAACVYDELNVSIRKHSKERRSIPIGPTFITQATLKSLENNMHLNVSHPIRLALSNQTRLPYSLSILESLYGLSKNGDFGLVIATHLAFRMLLSPFFLRSFMTSNCIQYMPKGLDIIPLSYRRTTLAGRLRVDDGTTELNVSSLDSFLTQLIATNWRYVYASYHEERASLVKDALKHMHNGMDGAIESLRALLQLRVDDDSHSFRRVIQRILSRLESESFECMICYEAPQTNDVCITGCCTAVYCKKCLEQCRQLNNKCANCRAYNFGNAVTSTMFSNRVEEEVHEETITQDVSIRKAMEMLSAKTKPLLSCFVEAIQVLVREPKSRVVVFCKLHNVAEFQSFLHEALPPETELVNMKTITNNIASSAAFMKKFNDDKDRAVVALCDKSTNSNSIAGIDFKNATSMIIDSFDISQNLQQQLIGRVLRMNVQNKTGDRRHIPIVMATVS